MHFIPTKQYRKLLFALLVTCIVNIFFSLGKNACLYCFPRRTETGLIKVITFQGKHYLVCDVDPHEYKIELFNRLTNGEGTFTFKEIAKQKKKALIFAMNAGMYEKDLSPVGLFIADGKTQKEINLRTDAGGNFYQLKPNGVFMMDIYNDPSIVTTESYIKQAHHVKIATQSGPMLIVNGVFNTNFQLGSTNLNIRNGVGINTKHHVVLVISTEPVNFYEFAQLFKTELGCDNALYLDGVISQSYVPDLQSEPLPGAQLGTFLTVSKK